MVEHVSEGDEGELSIEGPGAGLDDHKGPDVLIISEGGEEVVFLLRSRLRLRKRSERVKRLLACNKESKRGERKGREDKPRPSCQRGACRSGGGAFVSR